MIPKIIHYCWFGDAPKPASVLKCIDSWRKYCPDFEIREWTEKEFDVTQNKYCQQTYEAKAWGFVPDYIRLWIIYNCGGVYLDTDVQVVRDFSPLCELKGFAGFESKQFVNFGQGFGAEKGNLIILEHMQLYDDLLFVNEDGTQNRTPSPHYTTQVLQNHGLKLNKEDAQILDGFCIFPIDYFCPKDYVTGIVKITKNTFSIHQFDGSWFNEEEKEYRERKQQIERRHYYRTAPNRIVKKLLGEKGYEKLKSIFKRG